MNLAYKFFTIPIQALGDNEDNLNQFIQSNKIINIQRELISHTNQSYWCFIIEYVKGGATQKSCIFFLGRKINKLNFYSIYNTVIRGKFYKQPKPSL